MIGTLDTASRVYEKIEPVATYKPWNRDPAFTAAYLLVCGHTLVDRMRLYELWTLVAETAKAGGDAILEVGALRGGSAGLMALRAQLVNPATRVYVCDTFRGIVKAGHLDNQFENGDFAEWLATPAQLEALYRHLGLSNTAVLAGTFPDETAVQIPLGTRFNLVHIDVDVFDSAKDVFEHVWPRVARGGAVVFDDYGFKECQGVTRYVESGLSDLPDGIRLHNLNGHAVVVKR